MARPDLDRWALLAALTASLAFGCKPEIGDECSVSTDCSNVGDRLCDTTQPGGYCTIFNCEPGTCPEEAICVAFYTSDSLVCQDPQEEDRLQRTFCLRSCGGNGDCRSGYACEDLSAKDNPWGAEVVEWGSPSGKVCVVPYSGTPLPENPNTEVCTGTDAGFDVKPWQPDAGAPEDAGSDAPADASEGGSDAGDGGADGASDGGAGDAADAGTDASTDA
ncbi:MAG: hypothetical protein HS104_07400 [Polyangiaceae bacterium]|nr:hypothetical protein [Polyangiaceae bacterium]MCL4749426.1 hypothetical protein [Myxococcales bacterium]